MRTFLALIPLLISCSSSSEYTWGDASGALSSSYCDALNGCGYLSDADALERCYDHTEYHLCGLADTCDVALDSGAVEVVQECLDDMPQMDCFWLYFGAVPESCLRVLDLDPERTDEG